MSTFIVLDPPRWPGGPSICPAENLPALESLAALKVFHETNSPSCIVLRQWQCPHCQSWHAETMPPDPAGQSSGSGRSSKFAGDRELRAERLAKQRPVQPSRKRFYQPYRHAA
jgi:hypothetical protein